jgi:tetratricopeptide (TPR) repeat protein
MHKITILLLTLFLLCSFDSGALAQRRAGKPDSASASMVKNDKEDFDAAVALPPAARIEKLKAFVASYPKSALKSRALELIVSSHAVLGDEKLQAGDAAGGIREFRLAITEAPATMSDKLFTDVLAQIPSNVFLRGERAASIEIARLLEGRAKDDARRLLQVAAFYLAIEAPDEARRVADDAIKLSPDMSAAYQARAAANRIALKLEESAADYARALELDPKSEGARRSLADLRRATGKTEEALALYRERLKTDAMDEFARTGMVISLFELGRKEEAERELETALKEMPTNLALLTGAAYWFAAHNENTRAVELARKAIELEPRYTWAHVALARALLAQQLPMDAERTLLVARQYGRFPTLDYEMASVLIDVGLYGEAASILSGSFGIKDDQIETYLAGRTLARAPDFMELLAPERRASIFQFTAADTAKRANELKQLLEFAAALNPAGGRNAIKEADVVAAADKFINGSDEMRAFRRLYVAGRLLELNVALPKALEQTEVVTGEVETALGVANASTAVMAEELRSDRATANLQGSTLNVPSIPRATLANILRGRIEDLAGWILFNEGKPAEALVRLRRATSVLPERSVWWRTSMWRLGASLSATGKQQEALEAYYRSYRAGTADPTRRAVIESLYRTVNGSLDGLDAKIGPAPVIALNTTSQPENPVAGNNAATITERSSSDSSAKSDAASETKPASEGSKEPPPAVVESTPPASVTTPSSEPAPSPSAEPTPTQSPSAVAVTESKPTGTISEPTPASTSEPTPASTAETKTTADAAPSPSPSPTSSPTPEPSPEAIPSSTPTEVPLGPPQPADNDEPPARPDPTPTPTPANPESAPAQDQAVAKKQRQRRVSDVKCSISLSESALSLQTNGSALVTVTLEGKETAEGITASTSDWSAVAVFPEPKSSTAAGNTLVFSVAPISKKTGLFTVTFKSPCGEKDVTVSVK